MPRLRGTQDLLIVLSVASHASWWLVSLSINVMSAWFFPIMREMPYVSERARLIQLTASVLVQLVGIAVWQRYAPFWERRALAVTALTVTSLGALLFALAGFGFTHSEYVFYVGAALVGLATPPVWWWWAELIGTMQTRIIGASVACSIIIGSVLYVACASIAPASPVAVLILLGTLPLASALLLAAAWRRLPTAESIGITAHFTEFQMPAALFRGVFVYSLVLGFVVSMSVSLSSLQPVLSGQTRTVGEIVAASVLLAGVVLFRRDLDLGKLQRPILPLVVMSFLLMPILATQPALLVGGVFFGFRYFYMLSLIIYADLIRRMPAPGSAVIIWGSLASCAGQILSGLAYSALSAHVAFSSTAVSTVSIVVTLVAILSSTYFLNERNIQTCWGTVTSESKVAPDASRRDRGAGLARAQGLTPREHEVMMLLAEGKNADYVARSLVVSVPTARTHIHRIYEKFGIHSQTELMAILDGLAEPRIQMPGKDSL